MQNILPFKTWPIHFNNLLLVQNLAISGEKRWFTEPNASFKSRWHISIGMPSSSQRVTLPKKRKIFAGQDLCFGSPCWVRHRCSPVIRFSNLQRTFGSFTGPWFPIHWSQPLESIATTTAVFHSRSRHPCFIVALCSSQISASKRSARGFIVSERTSFLQADLLMFIFSRFRWTAFSVRLYRGSIGESGTLQKFLSHTTFTANLSSWLFALPLSSIEREFPSVANGPNTLRSGAFVWLWGCYFLRTLANLAKRLKLAFCSTLSASFLCLARWAHVWLSFRASYGNPLRSPSS